MAPMLRRPPLAATILTLCALAVLITLGTWQLQRLRWKEDLLADLGRAYEAMEGSALPAYQDALSVARQSPPAPARVTGIYTGPVMAVGPRTWRGVSGYHILAALRLPDNGAVLVNRGWVRTDDKGKVGVPSGPVTVTGLLRAPERPNMFVPENDPAAGRWYRIDPASMAGQETKDAPMPVVIVPYVLYAQNEGTGAVTGAQPDPAALRWAPPNNHLGYALFWYSMAGVLTVIYIMRFLRGPH